MNWKIPAVWLILFSAVSLTACQHEAMNPPRTLSIEVTVPDAAWQVEIDRVYRRGDRLLAVSRLRRNPEAMAAQVISQATDSVRLGAPDDLPVEHVVLGKKWDWEEEPYLFVEDEKELEKMVEGAELLFSREREGKGL